MYRNGESHQEKMPCNETQLVSLPSQRLDGKAVMITGAEGSIGLATASRMLQEGASLGLVDISREALDMATSALRPFVPSTLLDSRFLTILDDVTSEEDVECLLKQQSTGLVASTAHSYTRG